MLDNLLKNIKNVLFTEEEIIDSYEEGVIVAINVCAVFVLSKLLLTGNKTKLLNKTKKEKYRPMVVLEKNSVYMRVLFLSTNEKYHISDEIIFDVSKCHFFTKKCFGITPHKNCYIFWKASEQKYSGKKIRYKKIFQLPLKLIVWLEKYEELPDFKRLKSVCQIEKGEILIKKCASCDTRYLAEISKYINGEG